MKIDIQRLRNLTTGRLHTEIGYVYLDLEAITGEMGIMSHMLPRMIHAIEPWLRKHVTDNRFWADEYDPNHIGEYSLPAPTKDDLDKIYDLYFAQPDPLKDKDITIII